MVWHYIDAQHLGDYAIGYQPVVAMDSTCNSASSLAVNCCPKVYRPSFHYYTPDGDCLALPSQVGTHSGDTSKITPSGNYNDVATRGAILGYKSVSSVNPDAENKENTASHKHFQVTNKDHEIRQLWKLLVGSPGGVTVDRVAWWSFLVANTMVSDAQNATELKEYFDNTICLPEEMSTTLNNTPNSTDDDVKVHMSIYEILDDLKNNQANNIKATGVPDASGNPQSISKTNPPKELAANSLEAEGSGEYDAALKHAPTVCHVEDESDLQFIFRLITSVMNSVRQCQINNDREQQVIDYVNEVSECNEAFHQDVFSDMTAIDESELCQRYAVGKELASDLNGLYKENCCTKQNFFNDITLSGNCW